MRVATFYDLPGIPNAGTGLVTGGFVAIGANITLATSKCAVNAANVTRTMSAAPEQVTIAVPVSFTQSPGYTVYQNVFDSQGRLTHWRVSSVTTAH